MNLVELISALRAAGFSFEAEELADILWMANQLPATKRRSPQKSADETPSPEIKPGQAGDPGEKFGTPPVPPLDAQELTRTKEAPTPAGVYLPPGGDKRGGLSFRTAGVSALPGKLSYARALRPLLRRIPSQHHDELDEEATVHRIAETGEWLPVMRPTPAHWLELDVVVDEWPSVVLWRESIHELITLLTNLGAFRSVQVWSLWTAEDGKRVELRSGWGTTAEKGPARPPNELISVRGNRLVLVLSDVVSPAWYNGSVAQVLDHWVRSEVVILFHLLPYQYWQRTGLVNAIPSYFRSTSPGRPNSQLISMPAEAGRKKLPESGFLPLPTLPLDPKIIASWAQAVAGRNNLWVPGVMLPLDDTREQARQARLQAEQELDPPPVAADEYTTALAMVERFRSNASPAAWKLAGYFSATVPLSLPLMRLVQQVMLPGSNREHLAEFYLSGLIRREEGTALSSDEKTRYAFAPGVRRILFSSISRTKAAEVISSTSQFISRESGKVIDFNTLVADPTLVSQIDPGATPFAELSQSLLRSLGGEFAVLADALAGKFVTVETDEPAQMNRAVSGSSFSPTHEPAEQTSPPANKAAPVQLLPELSKASNINLTVVEQKLIQNVHAGYPKIIIEKELGGMYSGTRTFLILPVKPDGSADARIVTQIGPAAELQHEKENYDNFVAPALPFVAAQIKGYYQQGDQAALNYEFISGGARGKTISLEYYYQAQSAKGINKMLDALLDKDLGTAWYSQSQPLTCLFREEYERYLLRHEELEKIVLQIYPRLPSLDGNRIQIPDTSGDYPDPLKIYPYLLDRVLHGRRSFVHGNMHLRNVLVDESRKARLIDFSRVSERHNLFDFIKLETYIRLMALAQVSGAFSFNEYAQFERALNAATLGQSATPPANPELAKAWQVIQNIRRIARKYMGREPDFRNEYFPALFLYGLSILKYFPAYGSVPTQLIFITTCVLGQFIFEERKASPQIQPEGKTPSPSPKKREPRSQPRNVATSADRQSILIVDSELNWISFLIEVLQQDHDHTYDVVTARSYDEALKSIRFQEHPFDLVITEIRLESEKDKNNEAGFHLIEQIEKDKTQVIILTRYATIRNTQKAMRNPKIHDLILKIPEDGSKFNSSDFLQVVKDALAKSFAFDIFVSMPFDKQYYGTYSIIQEVASELGLNCKRSDEMFAPGSIMKQVENSLEQSRIIIADLTDKNPNVYFEVGISDSKGKSIILLGRDETDLARSLAGNRVILYDDAPSGLRELKTNLRKQIESVFRSSQPSLKVPFRRKLQPFCFAITSDNAAGEDTYKSIIQPVAIKQEMECRYVWDIYKTPNTKDAPKTIRENLQLADLIVTDLTWGDADAYYLSGFAFGLNQSQIAILDKQERRPFDITTMGIIPYSKDTEANREMARRALAEAINYVIPGNLRLEDAANATPPVKASIQQAAEADNVDLTAELNNVIRRYSNGDLDRYTSDEIAETIRLLQDIRNRSAHEGELASLSKPLSSVISFLSAAREYAIPKTPRHVEYYKSMRSARHDLKQIRTRVAQLVSTKNRSEISRNTEKIKILFIGSNPMNTVRINISGEVRQIQDTLRTAKFRDQIELYYEPSNDIEALTRLLFEQSPTIFHFSGHGTTSGALLFEDKTGASRAVEPETLATLFEQFSHVINCVILNANYSETSAKLIANHINYVIGMRGAMSDQSATDFSVGFYGALGAGKTIEEAFQLGNMQVRLQGNSEDIFPVLIKKSQTSQAI
jgi:hypothetical protein